MRFHTSLLCILGVLLLATANPAVAQEDGADADRVIQLRAVTDDDGYYFERDGEKNPDLTVAAGERVRFEIEITGTHNFHVGAPVDAATDVASDTTQTLVVDIPERAPEEIPYQCDPHEFQGMAGLIRVEGGVPMDEWNADEEEAATFDLVATSERGHHFEADGIRNPTLHARPGDHVVINLDIVQGVHNLNVREPIGKATERDTGVEQVLEFDIPEDFTGEIRYLCEPHATIMKGLIIVGPDEESGAVSEPENGSGSDRTRSSPAAGVLALVGAGVAAAALNRRR